MWSWAGAARQPPLRVALLIGGVVALSAVAFSALPVSRALLVGPGSQKTSSASNDKAPIILAGNHSQTTGNFHLAGGTYRTAWSAWGEAPEFPPCNHSAELMAVDPANATTSRGHVADLPKLARVPATGASDESYLINVKPGDYYLDVRSACGWQIALSPN